MQFKGRPNTISTKKSLYNNWVENILIKPDGSNLDDAVAIWEESLEPSSIKAVLYVAKEAVRHWSGIDLDIKGHIKRVSRSKQEKEVQALTKEEIVALSAACEASDPKLFLPFMLALHTGMRRGEVWGLRWEDVDILNNRIHVKRSYGGPTKSGKSRIVPISYALEKVLMAHLPTKSYNCIERVIRSSWDPNPRLRAACKGAGVRSINFHALRHTFATLALEAGRSPALVSRTLGHATISTTLDLYWSVGKEGLDMSFLPK